jgi:hypothetical protein
LRGRSRFGDFLGDVSATAALAGGRTEARGRAFAFGLDAEEAFAGFAAGLADRVAAFGAARRTGLATLFVADFFFADFFAAFAGAFFAALAEAFFAVLAGAFLAAFAEPFFALFVVFFADFLAAGRVADFFLAFFVGCFRAMTKSFRASLTVWR